AGVAGASRTQPQPPPGGFSTKRLLLEAEHLPVLESHRCQVSRQWMKPWGVNKWSNGYQLLCLANQAGYVVLEIAVPTGGKYRLGISFTKAPDFGVVEVALDGNKIGKPFDGFNANVIPSGSVDYGIVELSAGKHRLRITAVDRNPRSGNY